MNKTVSLTVLLDGEASVAEARGGTFNGVGEVIGTGAAKKHPKDSSDNAVGFNLAVARALRSLAEQYEKRANETTSSTLFSDITWTLDGPITLSTRPLMNGKY